jgi:hypothetical protein
MTEAQAIELLDNWPIEEAKVFYFYDYWPWPSEEIVIITRLDKHNFVCDANKSTINIGYSTNTEIIKLLTNGKLVENKYGLVNVNYRLEKSKGCVCGAWRTSFPNHHSYWCSKWSRF